MTIINGELSIDNKINLDEGLIFGRAVFETILIKNNPVFFNEHIARINSSAKSLGIKNFVVLDKISNLIKKYSINNCALKIILSPENIILITRDIPYKESDYKKGFSLNVSEILKNDTSNLPIHKWTGYIENLFIREEAIKNGFNDSILINTKGKISETTISNIFFIKNGQIYTPGKNCGILNGIIRNWIISNYPVTEGDYTLEEIINSDGAFLTNSLIGIIKISKINSSIMKEDILIDKISKDYFNFTKEM